jgi:hypothetical protein
MQAWQTFRLAPALVRASSAPAPDAALIERTRRRALVTSLLAAVLGVGAILLGLDLRYR